MSKIYNYYIVNELLSCAGQPTEEQFRQLAGEGFKSVINLGLLNTRYALADEAGLLQELGFNYTHIPVQFEAPQLKELDAFIAEIKNNKDSKILVHCAANYRASAFTGLYLLAVGSLNEEEMNDMIDDIWQPNTVWRQFIEDGVEYIKKK